MWKIVLAMIAISSLPLSSSVAEHDVQLAAVTSDSKNFFLTPIAIMRNGKLLKPVLYQRANQQAIDRFVRLHYAQGTTMFLWQSGQARGKLRLGGLEPNCDSATTFHVTPIGETSFDKSRGAIALSQDIGPGHPNYVESATEGERALFARVSQKALSESHTSITPKTPMKIHHLIRTRASATGSPLLVGSISFLQKKTEYWLFVILEQRDGEWRAAITKVHTVKDLEDRTDAQEEEYLDQLDIDGDGIDEIFTESNYYEAYSLAAYGLRGGVWNNIYESGVGGC